MTIQFDGNTGIVTTGNVTANNFIGNFSGNITVPGTNTEVIFNDDGIANGSLAFVFDKVANTVTVDGEIISTDANVTGTLVASTLIAGPTTINGNTEINGNLTVSGNVSFIDISRIETEDPMIVLGVGPNGSPLTSNDGRDRGVHMDYYSDGAGAQQSAFMGWINSTGNMVAASNVSIVDDVVTVNELGTFEAGNIFASTGNFSGNVTALNLYSTNFTNSSTVYVDNNRRDTYFENGSYSQPFKTIQAAVNNISVQSQSVREQNWSIVIASGVYPENINLNDKGIYYLSFLGLGRTIINPPSGNALTCDADNDEMIVLDFTNIQFRDPVVISGSGLENQLLECIWRSCEFNDLSVTAVGNVFSNNVSWKGTIEFINIGFLNVDGSLTLPPGNGIITVDDTQPAPFGSTGNFIFQIFNTKIGFIQFNVVGSYTQILEIYNVKLGRFGESYTVPSGLTILAYESFLDGTWTNNGVIELRNSSTQTAISGTPPVYFGDFGGEELYVSGNSNVTNMNVAGNIVPTADDTYSLGTASLQWKELYVSGNTIFMSNVPLTMSGNTLQVDGANVLTDTGGGGNTIIAGNVTISGDTLNSTSNTFFLLDDTTTEINFGGNATTINIGANTGNTTINHNLIVNGNTTLVDLEVTNNVVIDSNLTVNGTTILNELEVTGNANIIGNTITGGILTDNYFYANGAPVDFEQPAGSNTQIQFNDDGDFGASANFTFNIATNTLTVTGTTTVTGNLDAGSVTTTGTANIGTLEVTGTADVIGNASVGGILTDNYYYANGAPVDFEQPAGSNTWVQFNDDGDFGATSGLTFDKDTNNVGVTGNVNAGNVYTQYIYGTAAGSNLVITATGTDSVITVVPTGNGSLDVSNKRITSVADPITDSDAATKLYVDEVAQGLKVRPSARIATTGDLSATYDNGVAGVGSTLTSTTNETFPDTDGVTGPFVLDTRILVKAQTNSAENGLYVLTTVGDGSTPWVLTRCDLCDTSEEIPGSFVFVSEGTQYGDTGWAAITPDPFTIGTSPINWTQFSGAGTYLAGNGLTLTGEVFSVNVDNDTTEITPQGNVIVKPSANLVTPNIGNAVGNSLTLTGNLTSANLFVGNVEIGNLIVDEVVANSANISGNTITDGILTDNYYYANGQPVDFEQPAGSNTQIQYNLDGDFGASANLVFNQATNVLTVTGNVQANAVNVTGNITGGNVTTTGTANVGTLEVTGTANVTGNLSAGNIDGGNSVTANFLTGTLTTAAQPNVTSVGTLSSLAVTGNITADTFIGNFSGNITVPGANTNVIFNDDGLANASAGFTFNKTNNSVAVTGNINVTGDVIAQNVNSLSDATLKTNIAPLTGVDAIINGLTGVEYDWKNGSGHSYGLLAQDVEKILPPAVRTDDNGIKSVNYQMIIPFLIETIKSMKSEIADLKKIFGK